MCTILVWRGVHPRYPLVVATNRDEFLDRRAQTPHVLSLEPLVSGGSDEVAGGTWLAVTAAGFVVALTNRPGARAHDPDKASRGALVLDAARCDSMDSAADLVRRRNAETYNPFAMLLADGRHALAFDGAGTGRPTEAEIGAGAHAITNWPLDAAAPPIASRAHRLAATATLPAANGDLVEALHRLLADHGEGSEAGGLCVHRDAERYGTRSSAIILAGPDGIERYLHAEGFACQSRFVDYSELLRPHEAAGPRRSADGP